MAYRLDAGEQELIKKVEKITNSDYNVDNGFISSTYIMSALEELLSEYEHLQERYNDLEKNLEENYKPIPVDIGISERDFVKE